jgi:hypothetical protein
MNTEQRIPCPVCKTGIVFEARALIQGHKFTCPNCFSVVGIATEALDSVSETWQKYEQLKRQALAGKNQTKNT